MSVCTNFAWFSNCALSAIAIKSTTYFQIISDMKLALGVVSLVAVDMVILITYTAVERGMVTQMVQRVSHRENPTIAEGVSNHIHYGYFQWNLDPCSLDLIMNDVGFSYYTVYCIIVLVSLVYTNSVWLPLHVYFLCRFLE